MKLSLDRDFLLGTDTAKRLYAEVESLPVIDCLCRVPVQKIATDKKYSNIAELMLCGAPDKRRALRSAGVPEKYITKDASDYEKFRAFASAMPRLAGNPIYHLAHMELRRYFGCELTLAPDTCDEIWSLTSDFLANADLSVKSILQCSNVELIATTDDPTDTLEYHDAIANDDGYRTKVYPTWCPDRGINIESIGYRSYIDRLAAASNVKITDLDSLKEAYAKRLDHFALHGCRSAYHRLDVYPTFVKPDRYRANEAFKDALSSNGKVTDPEKLAVFKGEMLRFFGGEYSRRGLVMQIRFGLYRNENSKIPCGGADLDMIGDTVKLSDIAKLFGMMDSSDSLPKTVISPAAPKESTDIATLAGTFPADSDGSPRIRQGSACFFGDTIFGMREELTALAAVSAVGSFLGMHKDSYSLFSHPRHDCFRRNLCSLLGEWIESGLYPNGDNAVKLARDISYHNIKQYFGF